MGLHIQNPVNGVRDSYVPRATVKGVMTLGPLIEAKEIEPDVFTDYRHWDDVNQKAGTGNWEEELSKARAFFGRFVDGTFRQHAAKINAIEGWNEFFANSQTPTERSYWVMGVRARCHVWKNEYQTQQDYSHIRLVTCNTAIGNDIPNEAIRITHDYGQIVGYHCYSGWGFQSPSRTRWEGDWRWLSGRWNWMEQSAGVKPLWLFTEAGPFESAIDGWRSGKCLGGDRNLLVESMRLWVVDCRTTAAYKEGRLLGTPALFTMNGHSGSQAESILPPQRNWTIYWEEDGVEKSVDVLEGDEPQLNNDWDHFKLEDPEVKMLADMWTEWWKPGDVVIPPPELPKTLQDPSFEGETRKWNDVDELNIPEDWDWWNATSSLPNPIDPNPWAEFVTPEVIDRDRTTLPEHEWDTLILHGEKTLKMFKREGSWYGALIQKLDLDANTYRLQVKFYGDLYTDVVGGEKVPATDGRDGLVRLLVNGGPTSDWIQLEPLEWTIIDFDFAADGVTELRIETMCPFPLRNAGVFVDDWSFKVIEQQECRGEPRVQYGRVYNVIPPDATDEQAVAIFLEGWQRSKETAGGSYDDGGVGDLDNRLARLYGIPSGSQQTFRNWYSQHYPGVVVEFRPIPAVS